MRRDKPTHGARPPEGRVTTGSTVYIAGAGPVGLGAAAVVIVSDLNPNGAKPWTCFHREKRQRQNSITAPPGSTGLLRKRPVVPYT